MSEKLSEQMKAQTKRMGGHTFTEGTWWASVATLEAKLEAMERQAKAHSMLHNPPSSDAPISAWQRWKQDTDAAIAAAQEEPPLRRRNEPNQSNP